MFSELNPNAPMDEVSDSTHMRNVIGLAFDYPNRRYFFTDIQRGDIQSVNFNGSNFKVIVDSKWWFMCMGVGRPKIATSVSQIQLLTNRSAT